MHHHIVFPRNGPRQIPAHPPARQGLEIARQPDPQLPRRLDLRRRRGAGVLEDLRTLLGAEDPIQVEAQDVVADVSIVDREQIERSGANTTAELLARLPGLQAITHGDSSRIYIRGADARMTALYIDGVRVDSQDGLMLGGGVPWELVPLAQVDRIEVLRGAASAVYGSDAMGGVIQIFTKRGREGPAVWTLEASAGEGLARYETIQNNFSLNNRRFEDGLSQVCRQEGISLIPYSPLGGGVLSGKYNDGATPEGARFSRYLEIGGRQAAMAQRFVNEKSLASTKRFMKIAADAGLTPITLATAWSKQHDFVASTIVGATRFDQLADIFAASDLVLEPAVMKAIDAVTREIMYPMG